MIRTASNGLSNIDFYPNTDLHLETQFLPGVVKKNLTPNKSTYIQLVSGVRVLCLIRITAKRQLQRCNYSSSCNVPQSITTVDYVML